MSATVESLLALVEVLAQNQAQQTPIRQRLREDAKAFSEMNLKVEAILKEMRDEANTRSEL